MKPAWEGVQLREKWDLGSVLAKDPAWCLQQGHASLWILLMVATCDTDASLIKAPFPPLKGLPSPAGYGMHTCMCTNVPACLPVWRSSTGISQASSELQWKEVPAPPA